jgi:hypothetical protein
MKIVHTIARPEQREDCSSTVTSNGLFEGHWKESNDKPENDFGRGGEDLRNLKPGRSAKPNRVMSKPAVPGVALPNLLRNTFVN